MLMTPARVVYPVPDLQAAKTWYRGILGAPPVLDAPFAVAFKVGEVSLVLSPGEAPAGSPAGLVYWRVENLVEALRRWLEAGAKPHAGPRTLRDSIFASVTDPFGNVLGLLGPAPGPETRSVARIPSDSAMSVALLRALAAQDERAEIRGQDHLAELFVTEERRAPLRDSAMRHWVLDQAAGRGLYEFLLARTAYFDGVVQNALQAGLPQLVLLGAGYDSRPYRFLAQAGRTRIFELDSEPTQQRKRELLAQHGIALPSELTFIPLDLTLGGLSEHLVDAGFDPGRPSLFVWEGVVYYLPEQSVRGTLASVRTLCAPGSLLSFDYVSPVPGVGDMVSGLDLHDRLQRDHPGEPIRFRREAEVIHKLLVEMGFQVKVQLTAAELEGTFLRLADGSLAGRIPPVFGLVTAGVD